MQVERELTHLGPTWINSRRCKTNVTYVMQVLDERDLSHIGAQNLKFCAIFFFLTLLQMLYFFFIVIFLFNRHSDG